MAEPRLRDKRWRPSKELDLLERWEPDLYTFKEDTDREIFVIDTPPPYPSGEWHPGAVIHYSLIDMIARSQRMLGKSVLFPFGLDRNGINIERTVEKKYGKPLHEWDRAEFISKCREEIDAIGEGILQIARRMGMSMDFDNTYYTDGEDFRAFSQAIFLELFKKGLFYRGESPSFYCPYCETPLAEADIAYEESPSKLVWIRFPLQQEGTITIATTRPELLAACRAVIVHPEDERWAEVVGQTAVVPLFNQPVPVQTHSEARMDFGSGAAMICSYGDMVDVRLFRELQLEPVKAIDEKGRMTEAAPSYAGLTVEEARKRIIQDLESKGFVDKVEAIQHQTPLCERSRTPVEFILSEAWYLKQLDFLEDLRGIAQEMNFYPPRHRQLLLDWISSLTIDWPVSRRRYYHTEIPLWYCEGCGEVLAPPPGPYYQPWRDPPPLEECPSCGGTSFRGEERVFDTWMDSSNSNLWVTGFRKNEDFFKANFPCSLRPQGREIVRTWLYYATLKSWLLVGQKPFEEVFITGMGLDERGRAMHRTLGNYLPAEPLIEKYGADAIRFSGASETNVGEDFRISEAKIGGSQKFLTKLWNVARFISSFPEGKSKESKPVEKWILSELNQLIIDCRHGYQGLNFFVPTNRIRDFLWNLFAPHYLEMVKFRAYEGDAACTQTLHTVLRNLLRLLAPICPFITDQIWRELYGRSVHIELLPEPRDEWDTRLKQLTPALVDFNSSIWKQKKEKGIALKEDISGVVLPKELVPFAEDLSKMHNIKW